MMKKTILIALLLLCIKNSSAQELFTFGKHPVWLETFQASFEKNNPDSIKSKSAFKQYLNLYINFVLKVKAAYDLKMDTLPNQVADFKAYEDQIKHLALIDPSLLDKLINEATSHSIEEIDLSHIFIAYKNPYDENDTRAATPAEKEIAERKLKELQLRLSIGESFEDLAVIYSSDTTAKTNKGKLGFIKAFTLPYPFEKVAYGLSKGEISNPVKSNAGIHLFKKHDSKKVDGASTFAQILISTPEGIGEAELKQRESLAQTIYTAALQGADFDSLVVTYSEDRSTNNRGGIIVGLETGDYDPLFDQQIRSMSNDGQILPPFKTSFGFHIIKRISKDTLALNLTQLKATIRELVLQDEERLKTARTLKEPSYEYHTQLMDFKDGNLLFEIMDKKIWSKASSDLPALKNFHATRKQNYQWKNSVTVVSVTTQNKDIANAIKSDLQKQTSVDNIRKLYSEVAFIDSSRQEAGAVLDIGSKNAKAGFISDIIENDAEGTFTFNMVIKVHQDPSIMSFEDARIQVINDYQQMLEDNWIKELKKKYPVVINQSVLNKALSALH